MSNRKRNNLRGAHKRLARIFDRDGGALICADVRKSSFPASYWVMTMTNVSKLSTSFKIEQICRFITIHVEKRGLKWESVISSKSSFAKCFSNGCGEREKALVKCCYRQSRFQDRKGQSGIFHVCMCVSVSVCN